MASKTKSRLILLLKITVAVLLIGYLLREGHLDLSGLWSLMTVPNVLVALTLVGLNIGLCAWRWVILLRARGFNFGFGYGYSLYLIGMFFNFALPGSIGGDVVKGYYLVKDYPERKVDGILSILIDRILGLYSFFILTLIAVVWDFDFVMSHEKIRWVAGFCLAVFVGMTVFFLVAFSTRLSQWTGLEYVGAKVKKIHTLLDAFHRFGKDRRTIALSVSVSLMSQFFTLAFFYQFAMIYGETDMTWKAILFAVPMGFVVTAIPVSPAGVGVGQVAFKYLFETYLGKPTAFGATAITAIQIATLVWAMGGAIIYLRRGKPAIQEMEATEAQAEASLP